MREVFPVPGAAPGTMEASRPCPEDEEAYEEGEALEDAAWEDL